MQLSSEGGSTSRASAIHEGTAPEFENELTIILAGRAAERLVLGSISAGAGGSAASPVPGTAPMGAITMASLSEINAIPDISPECKEYAAVRTVEQVTNGPGLAAPGRTREAPLPSADAKRVLAAGSY
ncbi:hypothetical protein [Rhodovulum sulfidophilum]|uniref:hypothetical protein n=1 Tax=Rhodovulum sulfidophilum TaxID=35806 RepID=UPI001924B8FD|nr:hypothetical protein [Rhodovulum sulfidophilum]